MCVSSDDRLQHAFDALTLGVSICKMYDITPDDFRFKVEAINYKPSTTRSEISPITMETLSGVKAQIQQGLAKENAKRARTATRGLNTAHVDRNKVMAHMGRGVISKPSPSLPVVKQEHRSLETNGTISSHAAQTSNVVFSGPSTDLESRKKRGCEPYTPLSILAFIYRTFRPIYVRENIRKK